MQRVLAGHGHAARLEITDEGRRLLRAVGEVAARLDRELLADLDDDQRDVLAGALRELVVPSAIGAHAVRPGVTGARPGAGIPYPRRPWRDGCGSRSCSAGAAASTRSPASPPGSVLANLDRERFDVVPVGITRDGAWVLGADDPRELAIDDRALPDGRRPRAPRSRCPATRPAAACSCSSPAGPARCSPASTSCSRCCTARTARTARSRACWRWPACPTSAPACWPARRAWTRSSPRSCWPPRASRWATSWCCGRGTATLTAERARPARPAGVRQAGPGRLLGRHHPGHRLGRPRRRRSPPPASTTRRCWSRPRSSGREIECGVLERPDGTVRASAPGRDPDRRRDGQPSSTTSRPSTSTTSASSTSRPSSTTTWPSELREHGGGAPSGRSTARASPASTSSSARTARSRSTRSTPCPGSRRSRCTRGCGRSPASTTRACSPPWSRRRSPAAPASAVVSPAPRGT